MATFSLINFKVCVNVSRYTRGACYGLIYEQLDLYLAIHS